MKKFIKILSILFLGTYFYDAHCMMQRRTTKLEKNFSQQLNETTMPGYFNTYALFYTLNKSIKTDAYTFSKSQESMCEPKPDFQKSAKEELNEMIRFYTPCINYEQTKKNLLSISQKKTSYYLIDDKLLNNMPKFTQFFKDMQKTFDKLKILMNIPDEVQIKFDTNNQIGSDVTMYYNSIDRIIYLTKHSLSEAKPYQLFALIHEFVHVQQHMNNGLLSHRLMSAKVKERDADIKAARAINCTLCTKRIINEKKGNDLLFKIANNNLLRKFLFFIGIIDNNFYQNKENYLSGTEVFTINQLKPKKSLCDAHKDKKNSLYDHLSTVKFE